MKNSILCVALFFATLSCSENDEQMVFNESVQLESTKSIAYVQGYALNQDEGMLSFSNLEEFNNVVQLLSSRDIKNSRTETAASIKTKGNSIPSSGFRSIYDEYEDALNEADNYYDSYEHYLEFKERYSSLLFPEYEDDYSVYLPVSNKVIAKLLDVDGNVMINGEITNMKDVHTYEDLTVLGETFSGNAISLADYSGNYLNGTPELKNGGDRKLKVRVYTKPGSFGVLQDIVVDVSFRKKGAFGAWYNYMSNTTLGWVGGESWSKSGFSSHDYHFARLFKNGEPIKFIGRMYVDFQGFRGERVFFNVDI